MKGASRVKRHHMENKEMDAQRMATLMIAEQTDYLLPSVIPGNTILRSQYHTINHTNHKAEEFYQKTF